MTTLLYLKNQFYQALPAHQPRAPRARFTRYYHDLFQLEGIEPPQPSVYFSEGQYDFVTLGNTVLQQAQIKEDFSQLDLFIITYWSHEFDPDSSFGAYFANKYAITSTCLDVCDQGVLSPITAISVIMAYAKADKIKNAALLCFDQKSIPVESQFRGALPTHNSARLLIFSTTKPHASCYQLLDAKITPTDHANIRHTGSLPTIEVTANSAYYSTAEIFSPLFNENNLSPDFNTLALHVRDAESNQSGTLLLQRNHVFNSMRSNA